MNLFGASRVFAAFLFVLASPQTASTEEISVITLTTRIPTSGVCSPTSSPSSYEPIGGATGSHEGSGSNTILTAMVHWDHDLTNIDNLSPSFTDILYYSEGGTSDPSVTAMVAHLDVKFSYASVVLEHSAYILDIQCQPGGLVISFSSYGVSQHVQKAWGADSELVLVTHTAGCGASATGQRAYYLVESIHFSDTSVTVLGQEIDVQQALVDVQLVWGMYSPVGQTSNTVSSQAVNPTSGTTISPTFSTSPSLSPTSVSCGTPSAAVINGLPAASCGSNFDQSLDEALGYYSVDDANLPATLASVAPAALYADYVADGNVTMSSRRSFDERLQKRFSLRGIIKSITHAVTTVVKTAVKQVIPAVTHFVAKAVQTVVKVAVAIVDHEFMPSVHVSIPIQAGPPPAMLGDSPFGKAFKIYQYEVPDGDPKKEKETSNLAKLKDMLLPEKNPPVAGVTFYCVDCGINGNVQITGTIGFSILHGVQSGTVGMNGKLTAGLQIGVDAFAEYQKSITVARLVHQGLPGFSIPNIISVGPEITLDMTASIDIRAEGQLIAGVTMSLPNFGANLDIVHPSKSSSYGFTPQIHKGFNATGNLTASASLGLPLGLAFGIDILGGKFSKSIALVDTPSIEAVATFSASYTSVDGSSSLSLNERGATCNGVLWQVDLTNSVDLNVLDLKTFNLVSYTSPPLAQGCIVLFHPNAISTTSSQYTLLSPSSTHSTFSTQPSSLYSTSAIQSSTSSSSVITISSTSRTSSARTSFISSAVSSNSASSLSTGAVASMTPRTPSTTKSSSLLASQSSFVVSSSISSISNDNNHTQSNFSSVSHITPIATSIPKPSTRPITNSSSFQTSHSSFSASNSITSSLSSITFNQSISGNTSSLRPSSTSNSSLPSMRNSFSSLPSSVNQPISTYMSSPQPSFTSNSSLTLTQDSSSSFSSAANLTTTLDQSSYSPTSSSSNSAPSSSTASPPYPFQACPAGNQSYYTDPSGTAYQLHCNQDLQGSDIQGALQTTGDFKQCIDLCQGISNCVAVTWVARSNECFPKYPPLPGFTTQTFECDSATMVQATIPKAKRQISQTSVSGASALESAAPSDSLTSLGSAATDEGAAYTFPDITADTANVTSLSVDTSSATSGASNETVLANDGVTYVSLTDSGKTYQLTGGDDGNLRVSSAATPDSGSTFAAYEGVVGSDDEDRLLHYYGPPMAAYGVSRLRLATFDQLPVTSLLVSLTPIDYSDDPAVPATYIALDTAGNAFFTVLCTYADGQSSKVFLVNDLDAGVVTLVREDLRYTITGGVVSGCGALAFSTTATGFSA